MSTYDWLHRFEAEVSQIVRYVYFRSLPRAEQDLSVLKNRLGGGGEVARGFYDAVRGIYTAAKERDSASLFMKLYRKASPQEISGLSGKFKAEAFRQTTDDYERGFLIAWEIAAKTLSLLKEEYPDYPTKEEIPEKRTEQKKDGEEFEVAPRKKPRSKARDKED